MAEFKGYIKYLLFLSSYVPLFVIISIRIHKLEPITEISNLRFVPVTISWYALGLVALSIALWSALYMLVKSMQRRGTKRKRVDKLRLRNDHLASYLLVYVFVFAGLNFTLLEDIAIFILFFLLLSAIQIRSENLYTNPLLAVWGYRIYEATLEDKVVILISKYQIEEKLISKEDKGGTYADIEMIPMGSNTYLIPNDD